MFNFKKDRLKKENSLGEGFYGEVFPYEKNPGDTKWVVKRTKVKKIEDLLRCLPEIALSFSCDHPCIVSAKGYSIEPKKNKYNIYLKLPRMIGGNLTEELRIRKAKNLYYSESELVKHFYSLTRAVDYLHNKKIFHGNIKISHILLDGKGNMKLSGIGSAKYVPEEDLCNSLAEAENNKAPEIIQQEKKADPIKKDEVFLADSWGLGLIMLEICMLQSKLINTSDPAPTIEENLQKIYGEARKRYQDSLLQIVFGLLKTDPIRRLQVSVAKVKLEETFQHILTEESKASFGLKKQDKEQSSEYFEIFNQRINQILKAFEDEKKVTEGKLNAFQESIKNLQEKLEACNVEIHKIQLGKNLEIEEISKKYETIIQELKQENLTLLERLQKESENKSLERKPQNLESYQARLTKVSSKLSDIWNEWFDISGVGFLSFSQRSNDSLNDEVLQKLVQTMTKKCSKENLWENMDRLEMRFDWCESISDKGLKTLASTLGPYLSNVQHLVLHMPSWYYISDEGLTEFGRQLKIPKIKHLEFCLAQWSYITDTGLKEFAHHLGSNLENLEHLEFSIGSCLKITDEGLKGLASQIGPKVSNIKHLSLDLRDLNEITDEGLEEIASQFGPKLGNLEHLSLYIGSMKRMNTTDECLKILAAQFGPQLTHVKDLILEIPGWHQITDDGLEVFASQLLTQLKSVERLTLSINGWTNITAKGFQFLASQFGPQFKNLKDLFLNCSSLQIPPASLDLLAYQINENLSNLKTLTLNLGNCPSVTTSDKENFRKQIKQISKVNIN